MILFLEGVSLSSRGNEVAHPVIPRSEATRDPFQSRTEASKGSLAALGMTGETKSRTLSVDRGAYALTPPASGLSPASILRAMR